MAPISLSRDPTHQPTGRYRGCLESIADAFERESCLVFLGAGASVSRSTPSLPTGAELAHKLATACELDPPGAVPLSTAAFYFEFYRSRDDLNAFLVKEIDRDEVPPSDTLRNLTRLIGVLERRGKRVFVITTNYDRLFEKAYRESLGQDPGVVVYRGAWDPTDKAKSLHVGLNGDPEFWLHSDDRRPTILYKMHGCISMASDQNLVVTEEDYINFMTNAVSLHTEKRILNFARYRIAQSTILFVGYGLSDFNFRVLYKATAEGRGRKAYALQYFDETSASALERLRWDATVSFWSRKNVEILNVDAADFTRDLAMLSESRA